MNNGICEAGRLIPLSSHSFREHFLRAHHLIPGHHPHFWGTAPYPGKGHNNVSVRAPPIVGHCLMSALHSAGTGLNTVLPLQLLSSASRCGHLRDKCVMWSCARVHNVKRE